MSDELRSLLLERIRNIVRALALPVSELRTNIQNINSAERILVDDFGEAIAMARDVEARFGVPFTDPASKHVLERLEAAVVLVSDAIYSDSAASDGGDFESKWGELHRLARGTVGTLGWEGVVDHRPFSG